jgi:hypothetical protein
MHIELIIHHRHLNLKYLPHFPHNMTDYDEKVELFDKLIATNPDIERKGKTMPYTSLNGHMFTYLSKEGQMGIRLSPEDREKFKHDHDTDMLVQYGRVMQDLVAVPDELLKDTKKMKKYLKMSYEYTASLKPKATKTKKNR